MLLKYLDSYQYVLHHKYAVLSLYIYLYIHKELVGTFILSKLGNIIGKKNTGLCRDDGFSSSNGT